jgi:ATP dependent DNA ligase-like protein
MRVTDSWRPMEFGSKKAKQINNAICEPLWPGVRVLVDVDSFGVLIRGEDGTALEGWQDLRDAIIKAVAAGAAVIDGYVVPKFRDTAGISSGGLDGVPTSSQMARQLVLGGVGQSKAREAVQNSLTRIIELGPEDPVGLVAIDLLWLDGESLLDVPLQERKRLLDSVVGDSELVRRTVHVRPPVEPWYLQWRAFGFREFAVKDANSRYKPGSASDLWATAPIPKR